MQAPHSTTGVIETSVYVDNNDITPDNAFIDDKSLDTCRTYIVTTATDTMSTLSFDHLHINGGGHVAFRNTSDNSPKVTIGYLHGDKSGILHVTKEQSVTVEDNETPFPTSFRIYEEAVFNMPQSKIILCIHTSSVMYSNFNLVFQRKKSGYQIDDVWQTGTKILKF